jgi:hypothetical protein
MCHQRKCLPFMWKTSYFVKPLARTYRYEPPFFSAGLLYSLTIRRCLSTMINHLAINIPYLPHVRIIARKTNRRLGQIPPQANDLAAPKPPLPMEHAVKLPMNALGLSKEGPHFWNFSACPSYPAPIHRSREPRPLYSARALSGAEGLPSAEHEPRGRVAS